MNNISNNFYKEKSISTIKSNTGHKHVVLLYAGMSCESEVSKASGETVAQVLVDLGYRVTMVDMGADLAQVIADIRPDVVFNALHGTYGEDGSVPAILNILRIPYTHSGLLASAVGFNKIAAKHAFVASNIRIIEHLVVNKSDNIKKDPMVRPYVIKPVAQGSSKGLIVVFEGDDFDFADYNFEYGDQILVEKYVKGREMQVALLNGKALGALELKISPEKRFYDYEVKYTNGLAEHILPAKLDNEKYNKLLKLAEIAYNSIGCRGLARAEFIYDSIKDEFFILEINTHPGFTALSICPEIAAFAGINLKELVQKMLASACYDEC